MVENKMTNMGKVVIMFLFFVYQTALSQIFHLNIHLNNNDSYTRKKLVETNAYVVPRIALIGTQNNALRELLSKNKEYLERNYKYNKKFDNKNEFIVRSLKTSAFDIVTQILNRVKTLGYMTRVKKDYLTSLALDKTILIPLQILDTNKMKMGDRQEIYRLRDELVRVYSLYNKELIEVMSLPAIFLLLHNASELMLFINNFEMIF